MVQQGILSLSIKDRQTLYGAYMPFVHGGGLFVQSTERRVTGGPESAFSLAIHPMARMPGQLLSHIWPSY